MSPIDLVNDNGLGDTNGLVNDNDNGIKQDFMTPKKKHISGFVPGAPLKKKYRTSYENISPIPMTLLPIVPISSRKTTTD